MKRTLSAALSLLLAASASAQVPASALARIGTAAAVRGSVKAVSAGAAVGRVISSGKPLFLNDHVTTGDAGRLQVLLLDETVFTLGPNSDMVLDEFVYDPKTASNDKLTASISKGTFRFVTGKIASHDPEKMKLKVAVGTIGVRGSIGVGETGPGGTTIINGGARNPDNHDDAAGIYARSNGKTVNLIQPGVGTHIGTDGRVESARFMTADLNRIMGTLQTSIGEKGRGGRADLRGRTASSASGRSTAIGRFLADDSGQTQGLLTSDDLLTAQAVQQQFRVPDGLSNWSQIANVGGIGTYTGSAEYSGPGNTVTVTMAVNFGTEMLGGTVGAVNSTIVTAGLVPASTNINQFSYASLSGPAQLNLEPHLQNTFNFETANLTLENAGGTAAKIAIINTTFWTGGGTTYSGTVNATR